MAPHSMLRPVPSRLLLPLPVLLLRRYRQWRRRFLSDS
jgi:hypothetical protein